MFTPEAFPHLSKHRSPAEILKIIIYPVQPLKKFMFHTARLDGHFLEFPGDPAEPDCLGTDSVAGIAETAEPYQVGREDLVFHAKDDHMYQAAGIKITDNGAHRAYTRARTAGITGFNFLNSDPCRDLVLKVGIGALKNNGLHPDNRDTLS